MTEWGWHFEWLFTAKMGLVLGVLAIESCAIVCGELRTRRVGRRLVPRALQGFSGAPQGKP